MANIIRRGKETITKPKLLLIIGIAIAAVSLGLGAWAATITANQQASR
jgi:hypothetical protein